MFLSVGTIQYEAAVNVVPTSMHRTNLAWLNRGLRVSEVIVQIFDVVERKKAKSISTEVLIYIPGLSVSYVI